MPPTAPTIPIEVADPRDTSLKGDAEAYLRDPRLAVVNSPAPLGSVFDRSWGGRQKDWAYPAGIGDVDAYQFRKNEDGSFKLGTDGLPILSEYFVGSGIADVLNVQSNPTGDGFIAKKMPVPMRQLTANEKFVLVKTDLGQFGQVERWWIREGEKTIPAPPPSGGSFSVESQLQLARIERKLDMLLAR